MRESFQSPYRPDIDGLRALAVLAVVFFHAWPGAMRGGFVGVDVFFVISGYLISKIIIEALDNGVFSFSGFYSRRIKRIFPALILVLVACYAFGWFVLMPDEFKSLGKHIAAGAGFVSNIILWRESGYFDLESDLKPLLHLWSLGIEEQFYIFWPILLYLAWRFRVNRLHLILSLLVASFIANAVLVRIYPSATFYAPLTRAWELLLGGALAYAHLEKRQLPGGANLRSGLGLFLILASAQFIDKGKAFPGWWALCPTIGACLIISTQDAWINRRLLSHPVLVWFGLISFPLYLWHWPVLSFARILGSGSPSNEILICLVLSSVLLASLTYRFVEKPMRDSNQSSVGLIRRISERRAPVLFTLMLIAGVIGFVCFAQNGYMSRFPEIEARESSDSWDAVFQALKINTYDCLPIEIREVSYHYYDTGIVRCRQTIQNNPNQTMALIGDSHAEHLFWGIAKSVNRQQNFVYYTFSCLPFLGLKRLGLTDCDRMQAALEYVIRQPSIRTVILANFWADRLQYGEIRLRSNIEEKDAQVIFQKGLDATLAALTAADKRVVFAFDTPTLDFSPTNCLRTLHISENKCSIGKSKVESEQAHYRSLARAVLAKYPMVKQWDPVEELCDRESCRVIKGGHFLYLDKNHVSRYASELLGMALMEHDWLRQESSTQE